MRPRVLAFLRDESNRALLAWIGGGLAVAAGGLWAVFTFYVDHSKPPPIIEQKGTGIASGRDTNVNAPRRGIPKQQSDQDGEGPHFFDPLTLGERARPCALNHSVRSSVLPVSLAPDTKRLHLQ
jgi:hypothetical protein